MAALDENEIMYEIVEITDPPPYIIFFKTSVYDVALSNYKFYKERGHNIKLYKVISSRVEVSVDDQTSEEE